MAEQSLIVAAAVEFYDEVATLCPYVGGVGRSAQKQSDTVGVVGVVLVLDEDVAEQSADLVGLVEVGVDIERTAEADGKRIADQSHPIEVGLGNVSTNFAF